MPYLSGTNWKTADERCQTEGKEYREQIGRITDTLDSMGFRCRGRYNDVFDLYRCYEALQPEPVTEDEKGKELRGQYLNRFEEFIGRTAAQIQAGGLEKRQGLRALADFFKASTDRLSREQTILPSGPDLDFSEKDAFRLRSQGLRSMAVQLAEPFKAKHPEFIEALGTEEIEKEIRLGLYYTQLNTAAQWRFGDGEKQPAGQYFFDTVGSRINGKSFRQVREEDPDLSVYAEFGALTDAVTDEDGLAGAYMRGEAKRPFHGKVHRELLEENRGKYRALVDDAMRQDLKLAAPITKPVEPTFFFGPQDDAVLLAIRSAKGKSGLSSAQKDEGAALFDRAFKLTDIQKKLLGSTDNLWKGATVGGVRFDEYLRLKYKNSAVSPRSAKCELLAAMLERREVRFPEKMWESGKPREENLAEFEYTGKNRDLEKIFDDMAAGTFVRQDGGVHMGGKTMTVTDEDGTFRPLPETLTAAPKDMVWLYRNRGKMAGAPERNVLEGRKLYSQVLGDIPAEDVYIDGKKAVDHVKSLSGKYTDEFLKRHPDVLKAEIMGAATGARNHVDFIRREPGHPENFRVQELAMDLSVLDGEKHFYDDSRSYRAAKLRTDKTMTGRHAQLRAEETARLEAKAAGEAQKDRQEKLGDSGAKRMSFGDLQSLAGPKHEPVSRRNSAAAKESELRKKEPTRQK